MGINLTTCPSLISIYYLRGFSQGARALSLSVIRIFALHKNDLSTKSFRVVAPLRYLNYPF